MMRLENKDRGYIRMHVSHMCIYICVCLCVTVCVWVCARVYMYVCVCLGVIKENE